MEAAHYLQGALGSLAEREDDVGLWTWLSLYYFDHVCPPAPDGTRSPGRDYRHLLEPRYPYAHRHLIAGSVLVHRLHGDDARLLLATRLRTENRFHHELASRQAFLTNRALMGAANLLYLNRRTRRPKRGSGMSAKVPGTLLRFVAVIQQLDVNYDLYSMTPEGIVDLLPDEFRRWKPRARKRKARRKPHAG